ncbi:short-chain-enoyl-CoA hydratase [Clostridium sp. BJN0001]|uniref:short-chain-enoyl-CoA hydratase n=1 Tax=Clostridium sp. BJN0001 TaxID=2930219 RepID=UPI001FD4C650|nr:short-chain-enoyl-CoA hydratase [Clostridium sp. BJN0001]
MKLENVILEKEGHLAIVTINRPKALNALNSQTLKDLDVVMDDLEKDTDIYAVILTGSGEKSFVAGADIAEMKDLDEKQGREFGILGNKVFRRIEKLDKPVIAAVNGFALGGGCEISMSCDIRIASETALFGQPEAGLGITPGFGGTQRLSRIVGLGKAKEMIYTAKNIKADEAYRIGLVNKVVPLENLMDEAKAMASKIMRNAPVAVKLCKDAINRGMQVDIDTAVNIESEDFGKCFATEDQKEGMSAFLERRKEKNFKNK